MLRQAGAPNGPGPNVRGNTINLLSVSDARQPKFMASWRLGPVQRSYENETFLKAVDWADGRR